MLLLVWLGSALAQECHEPLPVNAFRDLVVDARDAVERGEIETVREVLGEVEAGVPCLAGRVERRLVADLWVVYAILAFAEEKAWQQPLGAALRDRPNMDRLVGRAHPIWSWEPDSEQVFGPLDAKASVYLDGAPLAGHPQGPGYYLLQKRAGEVWNSTLVLGAEASRRWLESPVVVPRALVVEASVFGGVGAWGGRQILDWPTDSTAGDEDRFASPWAIGEGGTNARSKAHSAGLLSFRGRLQLYIPAGLELDGQTLIGAEQPQRDLRVVLFGAWQRLELGLGVAARETLLFRLANPVSYDDEPDDGPNPIVSESVFLNYFVGRVALRLGANSGTLLQSDTGFRSNGDVVVTLRSVHSLNTADLAGVRLLVGGWADVAVSRYRAVLIADHEVESRALQLGLMLGGRFRGRL